MELLAIISQRLELRGKPNATIVAPADIERADSDRVSCSKETIIFLVRQNERKYSIQLSDKLVAMLLVQWYDRFAVTISCKLVVR